MSDTDGEPGAVPWELRWRSRTDLDPRLIRQWRVGSVRAVAWWSDGTRSLLAVGTVEPLGADQYRYPLLIGDAETGRFRELSSDDAVHGLTFAATADGPLLVSTENDRLRVWNPVAGTLSATIPGGAREVAVVDVAGRPQLVTGGGVRRWWLPSGEPVKGPGLPTGHTTAVGRLGDDRPVVLIAGRDGLSLWDLRRGSRIPIVVPPGLGRVRRMVLPAVRDRYLATVVDETARVVTVDLATGRLVAAPITAHSRGPRDGPNDGLMLPRTRPLGSTEIALVGDTIAVSTRWRVHLWNAATAEPAGPAMAGPVGAAVLATVRSQGRDLLLTGSEDDGVVGLWDVDIPAPLPPGHPQRIARITRADPADVVVSVDEGGTLLARRTTDGRPVSAPLATGAEPTNTVAAWSAGDTILAATGAGSAGVRDPWLRRFDLTAGTPHGPDIDLHSRFVRHLLRAELAGTTVLVALTQGPTLRVLRAADGVLLAETGIDARSGVSGFAAGTSDGRPVVVLSTWYHPLSVFFLDDLTAAPVTIPDAGDDAVLAVAGARIVTRRHDQGSGSRPGHVVRAWDTTGRQLAPGVRRAAPVTHAAIRSWPTVYLAHADETVALADLETGRDLCAPLRLPLAPSSLAATPDGDLLAGAGSDVLRYHPPAREPDAR